MKKRSSRSSKSLVTRLRYRVSHYFNWVIYRNKAIVFTLAVLTALLLLIRGTYAWQTYADDQENKFGNANFSVVLREIFSPNYEWEPGRLTTKEVYVFNEGNRSAFVRLSGEEFLLAFKKDIEGLGGEEGTGNTLRISSPPAAEITIKQEDVGTWKVAPGNHYFKQDKAGIPVEYYQSESTVPTTLSTDGKGYILGKDDANRKTSDLNFLTLNYGEVEGYPSIGLTSDYWIYDDGYFYYSERLDSGQPTSLFLTDVSLSLSTPNRLKNALYKLTIHMDGSPSVEATLLNWGKGPGNVVYDQLIGQIN